MAFSSADYQDMARRRRNGNGNGSRATQQVSQAARQARSGSSRQGSMANLNRNRPGVPAMPVQGLSSSGGGQQGEQAQAPGATGLDASSGQPASGQSGMMGAAQKMAGATNFQTGAQSAAGAGATGLDASSGQPTTTPGTAAGVPQSIQSMANAGAFGGGGQGGAMPPGTEQTQFSSGFLADPEGETGTQVDPFTGESQIPAGMGQDQGGIGVLATGTPELLRRADMTGGLDAGLPPGATEDDYFDRLGEERAMFEDIIQGLQDERGESQGLILKGISEQQRRQAEMNALAGRSVGGGFGGAMATTSAMGAAAMEEADRAIRDKMREAQIGWLDTVSRLNESERGREFTREMSDEDKAFQLELGAMEGEVDLPSEGGNTGGDWRDDYDGGTGGTGGDGPDLPGNAGAGQSSGTGESFDANDASGQALYREGWRPSADGEWRNSEGQSWSEVYPDSAPPANNSMQDYQSSIGFSDNDSVMANEAYAANPENLTEEQKQHMFSLGTVEEREEYLKSVGPMSEWYSGNMTIEEAIGQMHDALADEAYEWEDIYEQFADEILWDDTTYSDENGNTVRGDQLKDLINNMADAAGWNDAELNLGHPSGEGDHPTYGNTSVNSDPDKLYLWVASQPGLFREIVNRSLYSMDQSGMQGQWGSTDFANQILAELQQSGLLDPGR